MTKPICTVMVGLPGTGKSTIAESMLDTSPFAFVYSTDTLIEETAQQNGVTYDEMFLDYIKQATLFMNQRLDIAIEEGSDIIWDQTNLNTKKRSKIINRMKQAGYNVECVFILPPQDTHISDQTEWKHRLNNRPGKTVPPSIMSSMIGSLVTPTTEEGFDSVLHYNIHGCLIEYNLVRKDS